MKKSVVLFLLGFFFLLFYHLYTGFFDDAVPEGIYGPENGGGIELCATCPPGFLLNDENRCISRNLYQQYESLQNVGVGGLKTALPEIRDGFTPQQIDLGRYLFFDPVLSRDGTMSCATCHDPDKGFSDGLARARGHNDTLLQRSTPSLWN